MSRFLIRFFALSFLVVAALSQVQLLRAAAFPTTVPANNAASHELKPNQARHSQAKPNQAKLNQTKPNIILIVLDDWSVGDAGFYGNPLLETPAIDRIAREGVVMQQAYAASPSCAPSRAALMTGLYPHRTRIVATGFSDPEPKSEHKFTPPKSQASLPASVLTLPRWLKQQGYHTALIGKWNLGNDPGRGPQAHGFDINIGGYRGGVELSHFAPYPKLMPGLDKAEPGEYLTDRLNRELLQFIQQQTADQPFFLYYAPYAPHAPWHAPATTVAQFERKFATLCPTNKIEYPCQISKYFLIYAAMMKHVDQGIEQLLSALTEQGLADNTLLVLTSDNGGYHFIQPYHGLRGQKSELFEGGIRVPLIFWNWGARGERQAAVSLLDIFPSITTKLGHTLALDGEDINSVIAGQHAPERSLIWYFPIYTVDVMRESVDAFSQRPAIAIRQGDYKLIRSLEPAAASLLFDLARDPAERQPIGDQPKRLTQLNRAVDHWLQQEVELEALYGK